MPEKHSPSWKKIFYRILWIAAGLGFAVLFTTAMQSKNKQKCKGVLISIDDASDNLYVEKSDISKLILKNKKINPVGRFISNINMQLLEQTVEKNPWVASAQVFMDGENKLHVLVQQKQPLSRIFTVSGNSFYMDTKGNRVPLLDKFSARVPVFTNFPDSDKKLSEADSILYAQVFAMSQYLRQDSFWNAQIAQINITPDNEFELIPQVGKQIIEFGNGTNIDKKFDKLLLFYKRVLDTQGWETYSVINLKFNNEIVCTRANASSLALLPQSLAVNNLNNNATPVDKNMPAKNDSIKINDDTKNNSLIPKALYKGPLKTISANTIKNHTQP